MSDANNILFPIAPYAAFLPNYVLGWLRKPAYWSASAASAAMWQVYTPEPAMNQYDAGARAICETTLNGMTDIRTTVYTPYRDVAHMAATSLGYTNWGLAETQNQYGLGDLGGWLLDLLQVWGMYQQNGAEQDLSTWMTAHIGIVGDTMRFGYADVLADADAWLLVKAMQGDTSGVSLSNAMRSVYQDDGNARIARFYSERFGASADNVAAAYIPLMDGIDIGPITNFPLSIEILKAAAGGSGSPITMPSDVQADTCARAYAAFLANPHR